MLGRFQLLLLLSLALSFAGCASAPKEVSPKFGIQTMTLLGTVKFDHGTNSIEGDVAMRYERPQRFELVVTQGSTNQYCHLVADKADWRLDFPAQKRSFSGTATPSDEECALWVESRTIVAEAVQRAQFADEFTETMRGRYESGRVFQMELSQFRKVVGQVLATRMKLTCQDCKSSLEINVREVK